MKSVTIRLRGYETSDEEEELLRLLAEDLADIFKAPDLRNLGQWTSKLFGVESEAEVWREETRYRGDDADERH